MSFLNSANSDFLSARITKRGRRSIAEGNFVIKYFQVGDSEFDYNFSGFTGQGSVPHQRVLSPMDGDQHVKYPYLVTSGETINFGNAIAQPLTETIKNPMGPAGFVSNYKEYDAEECTGTTVECLIKEINITESSHIFDFAYAWGGDLDFSHSTPPTENAGASNRINRVYEEASIELISKLENGKVVLNGNLTKTDLAGLQIILQYDISKLKLDTIIFNSGNEVTNFVTDTDGRLSFGSIDQIGKGKIKIGTPYKLVFTPKVSLVNTMGLFYTIVTDAVDTNGNKIKLTVK
jgi:hypothetical protein